VIINGRTLPKGTSGPREGSEKTWVLFVVSELLRARQRREIRSDGDHTSDPHAS
jgi:hypothetical protein